jgi:hypothetical protein
MGQADAREQGMRGYVCPGSGPIASSRGVLHTPVSQSSSAVILDRHGVIIENRAPAQDDVSQHQGVWLMYQPHVGGPDTRRRDRSKCHLTTLAGITVVGVTVQ